jgi:hypothetical protein
MPTPAGTASMVPTAQKLAGAALVLPAAMACAFASSAFASFCMRATAASASPPGANRLHASFCAAEAKHSGCGEQLMTVS